LISTFLAYARDDTQRNVMTKNWRWHILDRPLSRYFHGWISSHEDQIQEFEDEFGDTAYYPNKEILDESMLIRFSSFGSHNHIHHNL
jgi:hypothetical protein